jgi:hypothetical protein
MDFFDFLRILPKICNFRAAKRERLEIHRDFIRPRGSGASAQAGIKIKGA